MRSCIKTLIGAMVAVASSAVAPALAQEANFPTKPVTLVVPYPPGGTVDILARFIAEGAQGTLGQPVLVENRAGAGGTVAGAHVASQSADGYTLFVSDLAPLVIARSVYNNLGYDALADFAPITSGTESALALTVNPNVEVDTVEELIAEAKARPGELTFSSSGVGGIIHVSGEAFKQAAGVDILHIPYQGGAASLNAVVAGEVDISFSALPTTLPLAEAGKVKILAVTPAERDQFAADIPSIGETIPGYDVVVWQGVVGPAGMPDAVVQKLHEAIEQALQSEEIESKLNQQGFQVVTRSPQEFGEMIKSQAEAWETVVRSADIKVE